MRADVRSLEAVDTQAPEADEIPEPEYDPEDLVDDEEFSWRDVQRLRRDAVNSGDVKTRRRLSTATFRLTVYGNEPDDHTG